MDHLTTIRHDILGYYEEARRSSLLERASDTDLDTMLLNPRTFSSLSDVDKNRLIISIFFEADKRLRQLHTQNIKRCRCIEPFSFPILMTGALDYGIIPNWLRLAFLMFPIFIPVIAKDPYNKIVLFSKARTQFQSIANRHFPFRTEESYSFNRNPLHEYIGAPADCWVFNRKLQKLSNDDLRGLLEAIPSDEMDRSNQVLLITGVFFEANERLKKIENQNIRKDHKRRWAIFSTGLSTLWLASSMHSKIGLLVSGILCIGFSAFNYFTEDDAERKKLNDIKSKVWELLWPIMDRPPLQIEEQIEVDDPVLTDGFPNSRFDP